MNSRFEIRLECSIEAKSLRWDRVGLRRDRFGAPTSLDSGGENAFSRTTTLSGGWEVAVAECVRGVVNVILEPPETKVGWSASLGDLGADDLDAEEIVDACEGALGLPSESVWKKVKERPIRLSVGQLCRLVIETERFS